MNGTTSRPKREKKGRRPIWALSSASASKRTLRCPKSIGSSRPGWSSKVIGSRIRTGRRRYSRTWGAHLQPWRPRRRLIAMVALPDMPCNRRTPNRHTCRPNSRGRLLGSLCRMTLGQMSGSAWGTGNRYACLTVPCMGIRIQDRFGKNTVTTIVRRWALSPLTTGRRATSTRSLSYSWSSMLMTSRWRGHLAPLRRVGNYYKRV